MAEAVRRLLRWFVRSPVGSALGVLIIATVIAFLLLITTVRLTAPSADTADDLAEVTGQDSSSVISYLVDRGRHETGRVVFNGLDSRYRSIWTLRATDIAITNSGEEAITIARYHGTMLILLRKVEGTRIWEEAACYHCFLCTPRPPEKLEPGQPLTETVPLDFTLARGWTTRFVHLAPNEWDCQVSGIYRLAVLYDVGAEGDNMPSHVVVADEGTFRVAWSEPFHLRDRLVEWKDASWDALVILGDNALPVAFNLYLVSAFVFLLALARGLRLPFHRSMLKREFDPLELRALWIAGLLLVPATLILLEFLARSI